LFPGLLVISVAMLRCSLRRTAQRLVIECGAGVLMALAPMIALPHVGLGQIVRGTVTEQGGGAPVVGALVSLDPAGTVGVSANPIRRVLSNHRGEFTLAAPGPGRYRVSVRRIGMRPWINDLALGPAETRPLDVVLEKVSVSLPLVTVRDSSLCLTRGRDGDRVASLWEAARTAFATLVVSDADTVIGRRLVRFERKRLPFNMEIASEMVRSYDWRDGLSEVLFASASGDSLSRTGYWLSDEPNHMKFYAPDAQALLSTAFLRDHCFGVAVGEGDRSALVGLTFEPVRGRRRDITGTLWLDGTTLELQRLEFDWRDLPPVMRHERVGGEVHFVRLPDGRVIVRRWSLRMPRPGSVMTSRATGMSLRETSADTLIEQGGLIVLYGLRAGPPGRITGEAVAADGKPLRWARVRLVGTGHHVVVDSAGRFSFDSVTPGAHAIVVEHARFDSTGVRVAEQEFVLDDGAERHFRFVAPTGRQIGDMLCPNRNARWATLRVTLLDPRTSTVVPDAGLRLQWLAMVHEARAGVDRPVAVMRDVYRDNRTAADGVAVFCSIEPGKTLTLNLLGSNNQSTPLMTLTLGLQENGNVIVRLPARGLK
jgi:hypothetical protein